jgi:hypothetical protein
MLGQKTSYKALGCCGLIIAGFFLGIDQENALGKNREFRVSPIYPWIFASGERPTGENPIGEVPVTLKII